MPEPTNNVHVVWRSLQSLPAVAHPGTPFPSMPTSLDPTDFVCLPTAWSPSPRALPHLPPPPIAPTCRHVAAGTSHTRSVPSMAADSSQRQSADRCSPVMRSLQRKRGEKGWGAGDRGRELQDNRAAYL